MTQHLSGKAGGKRSIKPLVIPSPRHIPSSQADASTTLEGSDMREGGRKARIPQGLARGPLATLNNSGAALATNYS